MRGRFWFSRPTNCQSESPPPDPLPGVAEGEGFKRDQAARVATTGGTLDARRAGTNTAPCPSASTTTMPVST